MCILAYQVTQIKSNARYSDQAENGKKSFAIIPRQVHAKGHSVVFREMNDKPVSDYMDLLTNGHICFNEYFDDLVENKDTNKEKYGLFSN